MGIERERELQALQEEVNQLRATFQEKIHHRFTYNTFESILQFQAPVRKILVDVGCCSSNPREIFEVFEGDDWGRHTIEDFFENLSKLQTSNSCSALLWHILAVQNIARGNELKISQLKKTL